MLFERRRFTARLKTLARASGRLQDLSAEQIVRAISDAAARWREPDFPTRVRASTAGAARTGYSEEMVAIALDQLFLTLDEAALRSTIRSELGSLEVLDGFVHRAGRPDALARAIGRVCIIASRTTIGVALLPALYALCAKCDVVVKDREDELVGEFFKTLAEEHPAFLSAATTLTWNGAAAGRELSEDADALVVFGKNETLKTLREQTRPNARFIGYGSRATVGYVCRESLTTHAEATELARRAARDVALYESEGCLSLHVLFVESAGLISPETFAASLAEAMEQFTVDFPPAVRGDATQARFDAHRRLSSFRCAMGKGSIFHDQGSTYCVVLDPPSDAPPAFLPRTIGVHCVESPSGALAYLRRHALPLEGFAMSAQREDVVAMAIEAGAVRLTSFGQLQSPVASANHGGRPRIAEFVRWIDKEL